MKSLEEFLVQEKNIGSGTYGEVKKATHINSKIIYALKIIDKK